MNEGVEAIVILCNKKGLHARAAAKFVKTVSQFESQFIVSKISGAGVKEGAPPAESSGGSILGLMMLGAECGSTLRLQAKGSQSEEAIQAIQKLIEERFGEE